MKFKFTSYLSDILTCLSLSSCFDDDKSKKNMTNEINMTVSSETEMMYPWESDTPLE